MNGQQEAKLLKGILVIAVVLIVMAVLRDDIINPNLSEDAICELEYGENWVYEWNRHFGRVCMELNTESLNVVNTVKLNLSIREAKDKYCDIPGFWELNKWDGRCEDG